MVLGVVLVEASSGQRRWVLVALIGAGIWAAITLNLNPTQLIPSNASIAKEFLVHAFAPALDYESEVPPGTTPLVIKAIHAAWQTVLFAAAAMGISIIGGVLLGFLASSSLMIGTRRGIARSVGIAVYGTTRLLITFMRSVHELLWAVLFLAAFGISQLSAVVALALPCTGILAKIFSELIDETPRAASNAIHGAGASPIQVYFFVLAPQAMPDILAYSFYRFECALRSSAVLGFFGYPTLGFHIAASFENLYFGEVWTYLYALFFLVALVDVWSGKIRMGLQQ